MTTISPTVQILRDRCERDQCVCVDRHAVAILFVFLVIAIYTSAELNFVSEICGMPNSCRLLLYIFIAGRRCRYHSVIVKL